MLTSNTTHPQKILSLLKSIFIRLTRDGKPSFTTFQAAKSMKDYNSKATIQRKLAANLLKYIVEAAQHLPSPSPDHCVRVLENACSHGVNSVDFALAVCQAVANRDKSATVSFTFNDLPDNDFDKVLSLISSSAVADFKPTLHTLGKSMYSPLMEPGTLDLVYSSSSLHWISNHSFFKEEGLLEATLAKYSQKDLAAYVSSRHQELRQGGKIVLSIPGVPDGESGLNSCFPDDFKRVQEIVAERGAASLDWMRKYCNCPTYSRKRSEIASAFSNADWTINLMELQDIEELGASEYREGKLTLDDIAVRTADMLGSVYYNTFTSMWVEYGGLQKDQAVVLMKVFSEALQQALKEPKTLRMYHMWVIVATKK
ncbi:hypothetical protein EC991_009820 [Linnemannia zychae]|nr:hypothetical protein EC991_009820 [Linnemannia zychae]